MSATLGLGTAQFGLRYGIANRNIDFLDADIAGILTVGRANGITLLDTASQYGSSEYFLGQQNLEGFRVVTKSVPVTGCPSTDVARAIIDGAKVSVQRLGVSKLDGFLVHDADDLLGGSGSEVYRALLELKEADLVKKIGVSVYDGDQIDAILARFAVDIVQLPVNVLDQRLVRSGRIAALASRGIEVHARSAYLQGMLLMPLDTIPPNLARHGAIRRWHDAAADTGLTAMEAALAFVRDLQGIGVVLVGAVSADQLRATARAFMRPTQFDATGLASDCIELIDPRRWLV